MVTALPPQAPRLVHPARIHPSPTLTDAEIIKATREQSRLDNKGRHAGRKLEYLWQGDYVRAGFMKKHRADLSLCRELAYWTRKDSIAIDRLYQQSGLYSPVTWKGRYKFNTIAKAIASCKEPYDPEYFGSAPDTIEIATPAPIPSSSKKRKPGKVEKACSILAEILTYGPVTVEEIKQLIQGRFSWRTVMTAKSELQINSQKSNFSGGWNWVLPNIETAKSANPAILHPSAGDIKNPKGANTPKTLHPSANSRELFNKKMGLDTSQSKVCNQCLCFIPCPNSDSGIRSGSDSDSGFISGGSPNNPIPNNSIPEIPPVIIRKGGNWALSDWAMDFGSLRGLAPLQN